jgi:hypothetical protein
MSLKSGFSNRVSLKGPGVDGELPHHRQPLGGRRGSKVFFEAVFGKLSPADGRTWFQHKINLPRLMNCQELSIR